MVQPVADLLAAGRRGELVHGGQAPAEPGRIWIIKEAGRETKVGGRRKRSRRGKIGTRGRTVRK
jgi:hypothetical protein